MKKTKRNEFDRMKVCMAGIALGAGVVLCGCNSSGTLPDVSDAEAEIQSEKVSEEASEDMEKPTEEASEEELDDRYSADSMIAMMDEAVTKWQYDDPDQMRCMMIAVNMEYIKDEDMQKIMSNYGYILEDLASLYEQYFYEYTSLNVCYMGLLDGSYGEMIDKYNVTKRFFVVDYILNQDEKCKYPYDIKSNDSYYYDKYSEFLTTNPEYDKITINSEIFSEQIVLDLMRARLTSDESFMNPYTNNEFYVSEEARSMDPIK